MPIPIFVIHFKRSFRRLLPLSAQRFMYFLHVVDVVQEFFFWDLLILVCIEIDPQIEVWVFLWLLLGEGRKRSQEDGKKEKENLNFDHVILNYNKSWKYSKISIFLQIQQVFLFTFDFLLKFL